MSALSSGALAEDIAVRYMKPSKLVALLVRPSDPPVTGGTRLASLRMIPKELHVVADDEEGVLRVSGPVSQIQDFKGLVQLFDVQSPMVRFHLKISRLIENYQSTITAEVKSNSPVTFSAPEWPSISLSPRVNGDNTITIFAKLDGKPAQTLVVRVQNKGLLCILKGKGVSRTETGTMATRIKARGWSGVDENMTERQIASGTQYEIEAEVAPEPLAALGHP